MTKVEEYANQIPLITRQAFKAFANDNRSAIVVALYESDGRLTFSHLKNTLEIDQRILTNELKKLRNGAIVDHYTEFIEGKREHSYYELSEFGIDFLKAAFSALAEPIVRLENIGAKISTTEELPKSLAIPRDENESNLRMHNDFSKEPIEATC